MGPTGTTLPARGVRASTIPAGGEGLRRQALDLPTVVGSAAVAKPGVGAVGAALPEFKAVGTQDVATPERREGNILAGVLRFDFTPLTLKGRAVRQRLALVGRPGGDLASARPGAKVGFRFHLGEFAHSAGNADLPLLV